MNVIDDSEYKPVTLDSNESAGRSCLFMPVYSKVLGLLASSLTFISGLILPH